MPLCNIRSFLSTVKSRPLWGLMPYKIFPLNGKVPATPNGFKDAKIQWDESEYAAYKHWGIATGKDNGIIVIDFDGIEGINQYEILNQLYPAFSLTYQVTTRNGGVHAYFQYPKDGSYRNKVGWRPSVDIRAEGGYVVAANGVDYKGNTNPILELPQALQDELKLKQPSISNISSAIESDEEGGSPTSQIAEGSRNAFLTQTAGYLRHKNLLTLEGLQALNKEKCSPPLNPSEVNTIYNSVSRYKPKEEFKVNELRTVNENSSLDKTQLRNVKPNDSVRIGYQSGYGVNEFTAANEVVSSWGLASKLKGNTIEGTAGLDAMETDKPFLRLNELTLGMLSSLKDKERIKGEPTGLTGLDTMLGGGLRFGELTALCANAKTGKSSLVHALIFNLLERGIPVGYASREMRPEDEVLPNLLSIKFSENAWLEEIDSKREQKYTEALKQWNLLFSKGYGHFPVQEFVYWTKALHDLGVRHFFIDHLHYCLEDPEEYKDAVKLAHLLKRLSNQLDISILAIIQPTKIQEGMRLGLHALRGGAGIGQALDNLLILERHTDSLGRRVSDISVLTLDVARSKLATPNKIYLQYDKTTTQFKEVEPVVEPIQPVVDIPIPNSMRRVF